jgi:UDP-glucose 4-epimerase
MLTHNVVEAARRNGVDLVLYASGSGVYGDIGETEADEDFGPLTPVSTYAASKLAGEALLSAYCSMFGVRGRAFRFANVVGARQTHGVGFDFIRKLRDDPQRLVILGDGQQSKSYIHIDDVIRAVMIAGERETRPYQVYNVATPDYITVTEIADIVIRSMGLEGGDVAIEYTGGRVGWRGDVPVVRLDASRIRDLGWECERSSVQAIEDSVRAML